MSKYYKRIRSIARMLLVLSGAGLLGCHKQTAHPAFTNTLLRQINGDSSLIILSAALARTHLDTAFEGGGPFTVFAPVDTAFINAGLTIERINQMDVDSLRAIVGYHIVLGRVSSTDLLGYIRRKAISLNPSAEPFVAKNYYGIFLNGIHVDEANIACADGVLQKIGRVSVPFNGNLYQAILRQPNLSLFAAMVGANISFTSNVYPSPEIPIDDLFTIRADSLYYSQNNNDENPNQSYTKPLYSNFTLLIPSDGAFRNAGLTIDSINGLIQANPQQLLSFMAPTVICGEYFTADFLAGFYVNRFDFNHARSPDTYTYFSTLAIGIQQDGRSVYTSDLSYQFPYYNTGPAYRGRIIQPDIVATNGVIQIVDSIVVFAQ